MPAVVGILLSFIYYNQKDMHIRRLLKCLFVLTKAVVNVRV